MPISNWIVIAIYISFGLLELWRSDLFKKPEQCRNDGIVEAVSTVLLLTVTQPGIILFVNNNGNVTFDGPLPTYTPFGLTATPWAPRPTRPTARPPRRA